MHSGGDKLFGELAFDAFLSIDLTPAEIVPHDSQRLVVEEHNLRFLQSLLALDRQSPLTDEADGQRDVARLEGKLDLLLLMLSRQTAEQKMLSPRQSLTFSASGFSRHSEPYASSQYCFCKLFLDAYYALSFDWWAKRVDEANGWQFIPMSEQLHDGLARWVFRQHRRQLALRATGE
jgi:hypothetical protein